jgi:hypothetical protein
MTPPDEVTDQPERRAISRETGLKLVLLVLMAVAVPAGLLANYTEPIAVALALVVGAYFATVAAYVWSIETEASPGSGGGMILLLGRVQLVLMLLAIVLGAALLLT